MYDYGARNYDPAIGRFFNIDRFAEKYDENTPYHYGKNNPIFFIDIQGDSIKPVITSRFLRSMDPRKTREMHDFGQTRYKGSSYAWNTKTNQVDITLNIQTSYSFLLNDSGFNELNPFIKDDVQNHEEKHQEQIVEGFSAKITFKYGGKTYTGTVDEIATQMAKAGIEIPINDLITTAANNINKQNPPDTAEEDAQKVEREKSKNPDAPVYMDYQTEEEKKSKKQ
ncbi:hypothetical protein D3C85_744940 [compost metagenome]